MIDCDGKSDRGNDKQNTGAEIGKRQFSPYAQQHRGDLKYHLAPANWTIYNLRTTKKTQSFFALDFFMCQNHRPRKRIVKNINILRQCSQQRFKISNMHS